MQKCEPLKSFRLWLATKFMPEYARQGLLDMIAARDKEIQTQRLLLNMERAKTWALKYAIRYGYQQTPRED